MIITRTSASAKIPQLRSVVRNSAFSASVVGLGVSSPR